MFFTITVLINIQNKGIKIVAVYMNEYILLTERDT